MSGRPRISPKIHAKIRKLAAAGESGKSIMRIVGCSVYTVGVALDPDFRKKEAARHREKYPERHGERLNNPGYVAYRTDYFDSDKYRKAARERMRKLRKATEGAQ
jgi:uncharacterized protein involved in type VI secretion and phage assembly